MKIANIFMEITFKTTKIEKACSSEKNLLKSYGKQNARIILVRLTELESFLNLAEIPTEKPFRLHK